MEISPNYGVSISTVHGVSLPQLSLFLQGCKTPFRLLLSSRVHFLNKGVSSARVLLYQQGLFPQTVYHLLDTVQIQSRHKLILALIQDFSSRYNTYTIKAQIHSGTHSRFLFQIQFRYDPDMDVILILIQYIFQIWFRYSLDMDIILIPIQYIFRYNQGMDLF